MEQLVSYLLSNVMSVSNITELKNSTSQPQIVGWKEEVAEKRNTVNELLITIMSK